MEEKERDDDRTREISDERAPLEVDSKEITEPDQATERVRDARAVPARARAEVPAHTDLWAGLRPDTASMSSRLSSSRNRGRPWRRLRD